VRRLILACVCLVACGRSKTVQDPLDYLRVGVDPHKEADAVVHDLRADGFEVGRRIDEPDFVAFDAVRDSESTVRLLTVRGPALAIYVPDVRWPDRMSVELDPEPRPDFDRDGRRDVVVAFRERDRRCLAWIQVDHDGFVSEVFRARADWGDSPCVIEIDPSWPRLVLEVSVPEYPSHDARVRIPIKATARSWVLDETASAAARWEREIAQRKQAIEVAQDKGDAPTTRRLQAETAWLEQLRNAKPPVLEAEGDGEEAR